MINLQFLVVDIQLLKYATGQKVNESLSQADKNRTNMFPEALASTSATRSRRPIEHVRCSGVQ